MKSPRQTLPLVLSVLLTGLWLPGASAQESPAHIVVSGEVIRPAAEFEPLGVNNFGDGGQTKHAAGNLLFDGGFEPIRMRNLYRVLTSGTENGAKWITLDGGGTSNYLLFTDGTYSGVPIRAYRFVDASGKTPYGAERKTNAPILDAQKAVKCVPLSGLRVLPKGAPGFPQGGWVAPAPEVFNEFKEMSQEQKDELRKQWRVYYEGDTELQTDDVVIFERDFSWPDPADFHPRASVGGIKLRWEKKGIGDFRQSAHQGELPPEMNGGKSCLELLPKGSSATLWRKLFGGTARKDSGWYGTLTEGVTYRYEAWIKGQGNLTLTFGELGEGRQTEGYFGEAIGQTFPATGEWKKVGFEFTAPAPGRDGIWGATLLAEGPGPIFVDSVKLIPVYAPGDAAKPFVINKPLFETLMASQPAEGRKGAARVWFGLNSASMASLLDWYSESEIGLGADIRINQATDYSLPAALSLLEATGDSPETRMVPWLMGQVTHSEEEYRQLLEYLAAPYDPATDKPETKPMAYKRFQQRGHGRPWTDDFRQVIIEFGNENWHNRAMANWIGFGRAGTVHQSGREYGLWAGHMISELRKSPYNSPKIDYVLGGNYSAEVKPDGTVTGYGQEATVAANGLNTYHSHATYIGPRWEVGEKSETSIDDAGVQKTLVAHRGGNVEEWEKQSAAHEQLRKLGHNVKMSAYEGGPSGFGLRAKSPEEDRAGEYYGKSFAMGTAMLDAWINAWRLGWTHQCYLSFGQGRWWNSHTSLSQGHRPSPGWLAQTLINRNFANADLLAVKVENPPVRTFSLSRGKKGPAEEVELPTLQAHASSRPGRLTLAVANLDLEKPAAFDVTLPIKSAKKITLHTMNGDPRDTNLDELKVTAVSREIPAADLKDGRFASTLPAGTAALIVFEN